MRLMRGKAYPHPGHLMVASTPKAYCLLKVQPGCMEQVGQVLFSFSEVVSVEIVDGPQDFMVVVVQASDQRRLVQRAVRALMAVEEYTEQVWCYPVRVDGASRSQPVQQGEAPVYRRLSTYAQETRDMVHAGREG